MFGKKSVLICMVSVAIVLFAMAPAIANETIGKEQLELIQASQKMAKEEEALPKMKFAMYAVGLDPEYGKVNLGGRFEVSILPTVLRLGLEGIELGKEKPGVVFFSLMLVPFHRIISPYIGIGTEISSGVETDTEVEDDGNGNRNKRYQLFAGVEIGDNFFLEAKYVNEKEINIKVADVYSVAGFKISF